MGILQNFTDRSTTKKLYFPCSSHHHLYSIQRWTSNSRPPLSLPTEAQFTSSSTGRITNRRNSSRKRHPRFSLSFKLSSAPSPSSVRSVSSSSVMWRTMNTTTKTEATTGAITATTSSPARESTAASSSSSPAYLVLWLAASPPPATSAPSWSSASSPPCSPPPSSSSVSSTPSSSSMPISPSPSSSSSSPSPPWLRESSL